MRPFLLKPAFRDYLWGGDKLKRLYNKQTGLEIVAESWELSAYKGGESIIADGELAGMTLSEFAIKHPALLGKKSVGGIDILIKLIDAKQDLSIQVHPDDNYAARVENGRGKTEVWHVLECDAGAFLYYGFSRGVTKEEVQNRIGDNTITEILNKAYVKPGDTFFIEAGTIHAIGAGILLAEIQQSSDSTYRVYDYDRRDINGNPRALHIQKAIDVLALEPAPPNVQNTAHKTAPGCAICRLASCEYFTADKLSLNGEWKRQMDGSAYISVICTDGVAELDCGGILPVKKGDSVFIPADNSGFSLSGAGDFIITSPYMG